MADHSEHANNADTSDASGAPTPPDTTGSTDASAAGAMPDWEKRFRAPRVSLPEWAEDAPDRSLFLSNVTGIFELYTWDRSTGAQRQATDRPQGTIDGTLSPDGAWLWWFSDTAGDEFGVWLRQPFGGGPDEPAVPGVGPGYSEGLALGRDGTAVVGRSTEAEGTTITVARPGAEPLEIYRHRQSGYVGDLSHDGSLLAIGHTEHGDAMHSALRVLRLDGSTVAELDDTRGGTEELSLAVLGFAPAAGDARLLIGHQRRGRWEPMIWNPLTGETTDLPIDLPGDVAAEWYPDADALLIAHSYRARSEIFRLELATGELVRVPTPAGTVAAATARPDGTVEYLWSSAAEPPQIRSTSGAAVLDPPGLRAPHSVPVEDVLVRGPGGEIHALIQTPEGQGPFPTVFEVHGGPTAHDSDAFAAQPAAWLDHGFAVVRVNYRGSSGYGREWTDALKHRVGLIELEDITAVRDHLVTNGVIDPNRLVLTGGSWGGYLTLLGIGLRPELWTVGVAAVPVADYITAYHDEMEALRAMDRTLFGGAPDEVPDRWTASSPITYVDRVTAPVYISAGVNDPRCPVRQIDNYLEQLQALNLPHEVYRYDAGHGSLVVEERIKQVGLEIGFALRHLDMADTSPRSVATAASGA